MGLPRDGPGPDGRPPGNRAAKSDCNGHCPRIRCRPAGTPGILTPRMRFEGPVFLQVVNSQTGPEIPHSGPSRPARACTGGRARPLLRRPVAGIGGKRRKAGRLPADPLARPIAHAERRPGDSGSRFHKGRAFYHTIQNPNLRGGPCDRCRTMARSGVLAAPAGTVRAGEFCCSPLCQCLQRNDPRYHNAKHQDDPSRNASTSASAVLRHG